MARGSKIGRKRKTRNKVRLEKRSSDESDEDYNIDEDEEFNESEDDYCSSLAEDESEESLGGFEDEEEWIQKKVKNKKAEKPRGRRGVQTRKKNGVVKQRRKNVVHSEEGEDTDDYYSSSAKLRKRSKVSHKEEENDDTGIMNRQDEDGFVTVKPRKKSGVSKTEIIEDCYSEDPEEKDKVSYIEEKEDKEDDDYESDDSDDEEFTPGEALKSTRRNPVKKWGLRRKNRSSNPKDNRAENPATWKKKTIKEWGWGRRKKTTLSSDSDFVSSASSDYEYTISEEEREQVREATALCKRLAPNLRTSGSLKMIKEEESMPQKTKRPGRKGKRKVVDLNIEIGKQVCGICLSEEGKRTVRGVLNCCSHYFCFACIMEWSKVESRCPLCKQRFTTISRTARAEGGHDLRDAVFPVPERDQVYQPSEEELRGYLDPYENFHCTECNQGGDDALMLLCDLCDSPAHTYCVGLGREVPDGNWYCDGCRPTALASSNPDNGASNNLSVGSSPITNVRETFDLNEAYVPETPLTQVSQSPRHSMGLFQPSSPSGSGAFTVLDRRRIHRQIHHFLNNRSRQSERTDGVASSSSINLFGSPIGHGAIAATQNTIMPSRMGQQNIYLQGRLADYNTPLFYNREPRLSSLREETVHNQASTSNGHSFGGLPQSEFSGVNTRMGGGQLHPCSATSNAGADANASSFQFPEATGVPSRTLQGSLHRPF
ncbi:hypothetical protein ACS0TY_005626 [Phlomoides rotata]